MEDNQPIENKKRRKVSTKLVVLGLFALIVAALIFTEATGRTGAIQGFLNSDMHFIEAASISYEAGSLPQLHGTGSGFFLATRNSMRFFNTDGAELFRESHSLSTPILFGRGEYAAIAEHLGNSFSVFNTSGLAYTIATPGPIISFALSSSGFASVITSSGNNFEINAYNNLGEHLFGGLHADQNIIPMLTQICHDGRVMAISYLDINDARINSFVNFALINQSESLAQGLDDGIFAANTSNPGQIIGAMSFMDNGHLVAISDTRLFIMDPTGGTSFEKTLDNAINKHYFGNNWFVVSYGENLPGRQGLPPGTIAAYDSHGNQIFAIESETNLDTLTIDGNYALLGTNGRFTALSHSGETLWQHNQPAAFDAAILGNSNKIAAASPVQTQVWHRVRN